MMLLAILVSALIAQPRPVFRSEIGLVLLQATVKNSRGELVTTLDQAAFRVYEDGKAQTLSLFRRDDAPISLGIALDSSGSMRSKRGAVEKAALALVRASNPADEVFVLNFGDRPSLDVGFTRDLAVLEAGIGRLNSIGGTALRDAVGTGTSHLTAHGRYDRKVLLLVTDGLDNASVVPREQVREEARRNGVVIYAIGLLAEEDPAKAGRARAELDDLTEQTGGLVYYPQTLDAVAGIALDLARQIRSQYTLGYSPTNQALDGSYRRVRVEARGGERLSVRTRPGYRAAAPGAKPRSTADGKE